jgi:hypothetical protein
MTKPVLALSLATASSATLDVSARTSRSGVWSEMDGYSGSDWFMVLQDGQTAQKKQNYGSLKPAVFYDSGAAPSEGNFFSVFPITFGAQDAKDDFGANDVGANNTVSITSGHSYNFASGRTNVGLRYSFQATCERQFFWFVGVIFGGTWVVTATMSDGSATTASITLPNSGDAWFTCEFLSLPPGAVVAIELRCTANSGGANIGPRLAYTTAPVKRVLPTGYRKYLQRNRIEGASGAA